MENIDVTGLFAPYQPDDKIIYRNMSEIFTIDIEIPPGFYGNLKVRVINKNLSSGIIVDFCSLELVSAGVNLPCVDLHADGTTKLAGETVDIEGYGTLQVESSCFLKLFSIGSETIHGTIEKFVHTFCYSQVEDSDAARTVRAHLHMAKNLSTNAQRILNKHSANTQQRKFLHLAMNSQF